MADVQQVYDHLTPFEQRDLMRLVVHSAEVRDREIALEIYGGVCAIADNRQALLEGSSRFGRQVWLPGQVSGYLVTPRLKEIFQEMREPIPDLVGCGPLPP